MTGADCRELLEAARAVQPEVVALRRALHEEPELGLELPATRARVLDALSDLDLEIALHEGTSSLVATIPGTRPGPTLLLRADMDALPMDEDTDLPFRSRRPGAMHACGHDAHTAMLVGAARLIAARRRRLAGRVRLAFQAGEEGWFGARHMIEEGLLDGPEPVDAAFALHVTPLLRPGTIGTRAGPLLASADVFRIEVQGRGGHASMPHDALDPVPVACEIVGALQSLVTRRIPAFDPVVLTVARVEAGTTENVIPERARLHGTLRSFSERSRAKAREGLETLAHGIAAAHGAGARVRIEPGYPVTVNDAAFAARVLDVGAALLGPRAAIRMPQPVMGAEDFAYVLERVPGAMAFLGVRPPGEGEPAPCHSNRMRLDEDALAFGTALHAAVALHGATTR